MKIHVVVREDADYDYGASFVIKAFNDLKQAEEYAKRLLAIILKASEFYRHKYTSDPNTTESYSNKCEWNRKWSKIRDCHDVCVNTVDLV